MAGRLVRACCTAESGGRRSLTERSPAPSCSLRDYAGDSAALAGARRSLYHRLCAASREARPKRWLPNCESALETIIESLLGGTPAREPDQKLLAAIQGTVQDLSAFTAPKGYSIFLPVPVWGEIARRRERCAPRGCRRGRRRFRSCRSAPPARYPATERSEPTQRSASPAPVRDDLQHCRDGQRQSQRRGR